MVDIRIRKAGSAAAIITLLVLSCMQFAEAQRETSGQRPSSIVGSQNTDTSTPGNTPVYNYKIINTFPHDDQAFTQGLVFEEGFLYEGTGIRKQSTIRKINLERGNILRSRKLPDRFFGEGITVFGDKLIQLTWRSGSGFVYDQWTFKLLRTFHYTTEGWGITHDGKRLIMSDGTEHLYFLNPETYNVTGRIEVRDIDGPVTRLNELEYVQGEVYANVWRTDRIAIIDPESGRVKGWIDLESLSHLAGGDRAVKTLNGIAYDSEKERLFVTGKLWPKIYEIDLIPPRVKP